MKRENLIVGLLIVSILVSAVCLYGVFGRVPKVFKGEVVNVTGVAKVDVKPDTAYITLGVSTTADTVQSALDKNSASAVKVIDALKKLGIMDKDIQTSNFWVNPQYDYNKQPAEQIGFTAENDITVKTTPDKASQVILAGATNGANNFYNFILKVSNEEEVKTTLIAKAIEDAKKKAEAIAAGANKKLGDFKMISYDYVPLAQNTSVNYEAMSGMGGAAGYATPVSTGLNEITVNVYITFELE
ncbi:MAG: SIMPL domain-containing protein [Caldiserica bacterium]|nr:SIMPL domain-containing protein [Caldisericota bacterium]